MDFNDSKKKVSGFEPQNSGEQRVFEALKAFPEKNFTPV